MDDRCVMWDEMLWGEVNTIVLQMGDVSHHTHEGTKWNEQKKRNMRAKVNKRREVIVSSSSLQNDCMLTDICKYKSTGCFTVYHEVPWEEKVFSFSSSNKQTGKHHRSKVRGVFLRDTSDQPVDRVTSWPDECHGCLSLSNVGSHESKKSGAEKKKKKRTGDTGFLKAERNTLHLALQILGFLSRPLKWEWVSPNTLAQAHWLSLSTAQLKLKLKQPRFPRPPSYSFQVQSRKSDSSRPSDKASCGLAARHHINLEIEVNWCFGSNDGLRHAGLKKIRGVVTSWGNIVDAMVEAARNK